MFASYRPILSLLRGTGFLLAASGLLGLLIPLRGQEEGFSTAALGLLGTSWAGGFIAGCLLIPRLVKRVGHVRAFGTLAACGAIIALLTGLIIEQNVWILLRACTGFTMAGCFMIIESWLNERATNESRGKVFGLYMMVTYAAIMAGQMMVAGGDISQDALFMVAGILFCCSLIPTAVSSADSPRPLEEVKLDLRALFKNSPVSFVGCMLVGVANGAWTTLGAVYGARIGISTSVIAIMMSLVVVAGAAMQMPAGKISDITDRRYVLAGASALCGLIGIVIFFAEARNISLIISLTAAYGALAYILYSIAVAHANDHADAGDFVKVSGGLLLLYGFGTMIGPLVGAAMMSTMRPESLFLATALAHISLAIYTVIRVKARAPVPIADREAYTLLPADRAGTPQAVLLDPRGNDETEDQTEVAPAEEPVAERVKEEAGSDETELVVADPVERLPIVEDSIVPVTDGEPDKTADEAQVLELTPEPVPVPETAPEVTPASDVEKSTKDGFKSETIAEEIR